MDQLRFWELVSLKLSGEATEEELRELDRLKQQYPETALKLDIIFGIWKENPSPREPALSFGDHLERLKKAEALPEEIPSVDVQPSVMLPAAKSKKRSLYYLAAAGCVIIILFLGRIYFYNGTQHIERNNKVANIIATQRGSRTTVQLSDGTKVWLNADSKIYYDEAFKSNVREVQLEGEAFFDVKHDPDHPFIIHAGKMDVRVLGTSFNVKAYPDDSTIETTLIKGKVEIDFPGNTQPGIVLRPNEKVVIPKKEEPVAQNTDEHIHRKMVAPDPVYRTLIETSWVEDKLAFRNESFSDVSKRLERWYNIHFSFEDQQYLQGRLTGCFKDQPIKNVMDALQISFGFHYRIDGDTIRIW